MLEISFFLVLLCEPDVGYRGVLLALVRGVLDRERKLYLGVTDWLRDWESCNKIYKVMHNG